MSLKYFVAVDLYGYSRNLGIVVNAEECDCPLDSRIIDRLESKSKKHYTPWTQIDSITYYESVQADIKKYVENSKLEFDFKYWGLLNGEEPDC